MAIDTLCLEEGKYMMKKRKPLIIVIIAVAVITIFTVWIFQKNHNSQIPKSDIAKKWTDNAIIPYSISNIAISNGSTPEFALENGYMVILTKENSSGWLLKEGDTLTWEFTKQPREFDQSLSVGYIKDGTVYSTSFSCSELEGEFKINAESEGTYYIYCLGTSSDPITIKEGDIYMKGDM